MDSQFHQFKNLKRCVEKMLDEHQRLHPDRKASDEDPVWSVTLSALNYVRHLPEEDLLKIRLHTSLITGDYVFQYWHKYPPINPEFFAEEIGYKAITSNIPEKYWIGEPHNSKILSDIGVSYRGRVINKDIMRYQSCISNLYLMGILDRLHAQSEKGLIMEVGGGYGALAHHIIGLLKDKVTYVIIDLPEMLMFSASYIIANNPDKKIYIYDKESWTPDLLKNKTPEYDVMFIPHYALDSLYALPSLDLMINMQSFQEMSESVVERYLKFGNEKLKGWFYSNNIDRHPFNDPSVAVNVTRSMNKFFKLFPSPDIYQDSSLNSAHPWYYKTYFGIPKASPQTFTDQSQVKIRRYVPSSQVSSLGFPPVVWETIKNI